MEVTDRLHYLTGLLSGKGLPVPIGKEIGWAPKSVWTRWRTEKKLFPAPAGNETRP